MCTVGEVKTSETFSKCLGVIFCNFVIPAEVLRLESNCIFVFVGEVLGIEGGELLPTFLGKPHCNINTN